MSTIRRESKIDFLAVLTFYVVFNDLDYAYSKSTILEVIREGLFEYWFYLALINATT